MKKLMFATALVAGVALNGLCLESANIVGYQEIELAPATESSPSYSLFTATFQEISGKGTFNIQGIQIYKNGALCEDGSANVTICQMAEDGEYLVNYGWRKYTRSQVTNIGWHRGITFQTDVALRDGEGVCFINSYPSTDKITIRISGQVNLTPSAGDVAPGKYTLIGNMTPSEIDLQDIKVYEGGSICEVGTAYVTLCKMDIEGEYGVNYGWRKYTRSQVTNIGWHRGITFQTPGMVKFAPGEAACIQNTSDLETGTTVTIKMKSPIEK